MLLQCSLGTLLKVTDVITIGSLQEIPSLAML